MDPQCDDYWLPMYRIVELYDQCGIDRRRVRRWLNNAYWRGEFEPYIRPSSSNYPMMHRREILPVWRDYVHPGIHFSSNEIPIEPNDDGSIIVDLCSSIVLSERTEECTDQHYEPAYRVLAHVNHNGVALDCEAGLMCQFVGGYELFAICIKLGVAPPPFWRRFWPRRKGDAHKLAQLARWLHSRIEAHERVTREQVRAEAEKYSIRSIDKIWDVLALDCWKLRGRIKGTKNRH
jgi:hypothetical protein